jgi:DNA repair protein RecN (Recombination protein N)
VGSRSGIVRNWLARRCQVVVVTHLAPVAAFADRHIVVDRPGRGNEATVTEVTGKGRERELARMLSGQLDSAAARAHAAELLSLATG